MFSAQLSSPTALCTSIHFPKTSSLRRQTSCSTELVLYLGRIVSIEIWVAAKVDIVDTKDTNRGKIQCVTVFES
eukprot:5480795-Amphidinium_carterae.1